MMICPSTEVGFISTPRSGTHTMYKVLAEHYGGERHAGYHHRKRPPEGADWFWFTTCRNPFARAASSWQCLFCFPQTAARKRIRAAAGEDFLSFMAWAVARPSPWYPAWPQSRWHDSIKTDAIIPIERFVEKAREFPWWKGPDVLPVECKSPHGDWRQYMTDEIAALVVEWASDDFERYEYSTDWRSYGPDPKANEPDDNDSGVGTA